MDVHRVSVGKSSSISSCQIHQPWLLRTEPRPEMKAVQMRESAACDSWNFQHVPFNARCCPYSSNYWTLTNLNDPNSPKCQVSCVIEQFLCGEKRIWHGAAGLESGGDLWYIKMTFYQLYVWLIWAQHHRVSLCLGICQCVCKQEWNTVQLWKWREGAET